MSSNYYFYCIKRMRSKPHTPACTAQDGVEEGAAVETFVGGCKARVQSVLSAVQQQERRRNHFFVVVVVRALFCSPTHVIRFPFSLSFRLYSESPADVSNVTKPQQCAQIVTLVVPFVAHSPP